MLDGISLDLIALASNFILKNNFRNSDIYFCRLYITTHYNDVIMGTMTSQNTSLMIVYSTVYSDADQENIKAPRHWPLCGEFTGDRWIPHTNDQ